MDKSQARTISIKIVMEMEMGFILITFYSECIFIESYVELISTLAPKVTCPPTHSSPKI